QLVAAETADARLQIHRRSAVHHPDGLWRTPLLALPAAAAGSRIEPWPGLEQIVHPPFQDRGEKKPVEVQGHPDRRRAESRDSNVLDALSHHVQPLPVRRTQATLCGLPDGGDL